MSFSIDGFAQTFGSPNSSGDPEFPALVLMPREDQLNNYSRMAS